MGSILIRVKRWSLPILLSAALLAGCNSSDGSEEATTAARAPDADIPLVSEFDLKAYRGKVLVLNFWATWCGPCVREMPSLVRLQQRLGGDSFTVIALSEDLKGFDVITPFIAKHELGALPVFHDPKGRSLLALKVLGLPTSVLFDRAGNELGRLTGHAEWDSDEAVVLIRHFLDQG